MEKGQRIQLSSNYKKQNVAVNQTTALSEMSLDPFVKLKKLGLFPLLKGDIRCCKTRFVSFWKKKRKIENKSNPFLNQVKHPFLHTCGHNLLTIKIYVINKIKKFCYSVIIHILMCHHNMYTKFINVSILFKNM